MLSTLPPSPTPPTPHPSSMSTQYNVFMNEIGLVKIQFPFKCLLNLDLTLAQLQTLSGGVVLISHLQSSSLERPKVSRE